ncbi:hypothetical protein C1631_006505 [Chryseobacterium phosphatilyticum]|uniref:Secretion system C-terminal sorting domain-containing protein n=1 Tax=Chryseobacterium phosphatilyticum TaxID=475075 RepID=A0A316XHI6_9FLAO|nr:T9SS type A sorting domain-containing protein [Chryseobacterium phosphatilyticum]PWN72246.1 hypothetical protein C1631_006505 [Chryseobacterium phosphatilyticum]
MGAIILSTLLNIHAQEVLWQRDIKSSTQDFLSQITTTIDGQYLITGSSIQAKIESPAAKSQKLNNGYDFHLIKLDQQGNEMWKRYFSGGNHDYLSATVTTQDGEFLLSGTSYSGKGLDKKDDSKGGSDIWLIQINEFGDEQWQKSYNLGNRDVLMGMNAIHSADDTETKGLLLGGYTQAEGKIQENDETFWLLYIDSQGNEKWRKHVKGESKKREERLSDFKLNRDGSVVLTGTSANELGKESWKIVKLGDKQVDQLIEKQDIKIYPNPVSDYAYVEIELDPSKGSGRGFEADITLYDMGGRQLQSLRTKNKVTKINTQNLIDGAYLVTVKTNENKTASTKLIKK